MDRRVKAESPGIHEVHGMSHRRRAYFDGRNAGKSTVAGLIGLLLFIGTICRKEWLMAAFSGLFTAQAFCLSFWLMRPSAGKHRRLIKWLMLASLIFFAVCLFLIEKQNGYMK